MTFSLIWMHDVLLQAGLKVAPCDGWQTRGHGNLAAVRGIICHHTAGPRTGNMPTLGTLIAGRQGLPGPLSQLGLGRDGTFYLIAAGRANHAGAGSWQGVQTGNASFIGIEAENTGLPGDQPWPEVQMDAYRRGAAALLGHLGLTAEACAGHKEYALPAGRKIDPTFDMNQFRAAVAAILSGSVATPPLIPAREPPTNGKVPRATLRRGATGDLVRALQKLLSTEPDGTFGPITEARVREVQRQLHLVPDGIVGPKTWQMLDEHAAGGGPG
jgi:peptidoglycan hydrolase-like protein with peptidoglycan-binding domain